MKALNKLISIVSKHRLFTTVCVVLVVIQAQIVFILSRTTDIQQTMYGYMLMQEIYVANVDLTKSSVCWIGNDLGVSIEKVTPYMTGVTIKGDLINANAVPIRDARLKVEFRNGSRQNHVVMGSISPGWGRNFEIHIPNVPQEEAVSCRM
jgi:hypothetical protein